MKMATDAYSESSQTSKMKLFEKTVNGWVLNVWLNSEYAFALCHIPLVNFL